MRPGNGQVREMRFEIDILDRFEGTLIGCAVGDALGAPVEGMSRDTIRDMHGEVTDFLEGGFGVGRITDDTQMTVSLTQSIVEMGCFSARHAGSKFANWIAASDAGVKEARGVGMACGIACRRLLEGASPHESGVDSAGCGAAMRAGPIGLRYYDDKKELLWASVEQARITHTHMSAQAGSAAVAYAVALGLEDEGDLDLAAFTSAVAGFVRQLDTNMATRIEGLTDYLDASPEEGFAYTGTGGHVIETVPAALFAFLLCPYDMERTLIEAVSAGGDTDSVAAIAGTVSGSFNGVAAVPRRWRDLVEGREYIEGLAQKLFTLTPASKPRREPLF